MLEFDPRPVAALAAGTLWTWVQLSGLTTVVRSVAAGTAALMSASLAEPLAAATGVHLNICYFLIASLGWWVMDIIGGVVRDKRWAVAEVKRRISGTPLPTTKEGKDD